MMALSNPMAGPTHATGTRIVRAAAYAVCVSLLYYFPIST
jgi:hypothetical protein